MALPYKVKIDNGQEVKTHQINVSAKGQGNSQALVIKAQKGSKYQLQEDIEIKGAVRTVAPDYVKVKRIGKDLHVFFEGQSQANLILQDYYDVIDPEAHALVGQAENGNFYE